jgi:chaperonin cofactor prefoldin
MVADMIQLYFDLGQREKGRELMNRFAPELRKSFEFFSRRESTKNEFSTASDILVWVLGIAQSDVYNEMEENAAKATELLCQYLTWMPVELMEIRPDSQVWISYFQQCHALDVLDKAAEQFDPYIDSLVPLFESYLDEYSRLNSSLDSISQKKEQLESEFYDIYYSYSSAQPSEQAMLERKMEKLESDFQKLVEQENKFSSSLIDIEDVIYSCLYIFEDAIVLSKLYDSDKTDILQSLIKSAYGE